ncbi:polyhydroxyalkanoate depolymerase [Azohydromonas aeria]|uniref:polyhydroxyalkanoate depolymerase n=1 Tax=Azohydromonas aeria TaxID=2590212 RepID=UPI0012FB8CE9|nr:polyhydroxyalkanoate depolymerase [Azohydromonas aeria]
MLYDTYQVQADLMRPLRAAARHAAPTLARRRPGLDSLTQRHLAAAFEVFNLAEITHQRPDWGIRSVTVQGREVAVTEEAVAVTPFATLRRFRKDMAEPPGERVLLVAPMSGHFATLLRDTVRTLLQDLDVYVTDWHSARDVPLAAGRFGLDEYTEHLMGFLRTLGPGAHLMAICQPCVAALAATALMAEDGEPATPSSLTLMAGPIDCRINPTTVNRLATEKPIAWFEDNVISVVPRRLPGGGRRVYPGFVQLGAFMNMNRERHVKAFHDYYLHLVTDDHDKALATRSFYEEYFAVADLPAEFFLETVRLVFQEYALPRGELRFRGRPVRAEAIRRTALLTVEGERDDICSTGQTLAAQDLCSKVRPYLRTHFVQADVGHYGVFSGKRWQKYIYPMVRNVIHNAR